MLKAASYRGSDNGVINYSLDETGCIPLHVNRPLLWSSADGDIFSSLSWEDSLIGESVGYK
jgi:hypothetical protein